MSLGALIGLALVVIVAALVIGAVVMRGQPRRPDRSGSGDGSAYPASATDARDSTDRGPHRDPDGTPNTGGDAGGDGGGGDGGGGDGGSD